MPEGSTMDSKASSGKRVGRSGEVAKEPVEWGRLPVARDTAGGVGSRTIWRWASQGFIRTSRVGRITLFDLNSIRTLIEKNASGGAA